MPFLPLSQKTPDVVVSDDFITGLIDRGVIPAGASRVILNFQMGKIVRVLYECLAERHFVEALMDIEFGIGNVKKAELEDLDPGKLG